MRHRFLGCPRRANATSSEGASSCTASTVNIKLLPQHRSGSHHGSREQEQVAADGVASDPRSARHFIPVLLAP